MNPDKPTRRHVLMGIAAASLFPSLAESSLAADATMDSESSSSLCFTSAVEMAQLIRAKKLSAREAMAAHLKQIERVNPQVNAIVTLVAEMATCLEQRLGDQGAGREAQVAAAPQISGIKLLLHVVAERLGRIGWKGDR